MSGLRIPGPTCLYLSLAPPRNDPGTLHPSATPRPGTVGSVGGSTLTASPHADAHQVASDLNRSEGPTSGHVVTSRVHKHIHSASRLDHLLRKFAKQAARYNRQVDRTIERHSKLDLKNIEGRVAQIFFATDSSTLSRDDKQTLLGVYNTYTKVMQLARVNMRFVGYADYRGTEKHNQKLSQQRAEAVAAYFEPMRSSSNYTYKIDAKGESEQPQTGTTGRELVNFRRVDVYAYPTLEKPPPKPEPSGGGLATSKRWKWRFKTNAVWPAKTVPELKVIGFGPALAFIEICDFDNKIAMTFTYSGYGPSIGGGASWGGEWDQFETTAPLNILDFIGPVFHMGGAVQLGTGPAVDMLVLGGPAMRDADAVTLWALESSSTGYTGELFHHHHIKPKPFPALGADFGFLARLSAPERVEEDYAEEWEAESHVRKRVGHLRDSARRLGARVRHLISLFR